MKSHQGLKTGDILHCRGHKWLSKSIMWATKSDVSHTAIFVEVWGQPCVIDSQKDGTNIRPFYEWVKKYNYDFTISRKVGIDEKAIAKRALQKVGFTGYDFEGLIIKQPLKILFGTWKNKANEDNRMFCSEYVAWVHEIPNHNRLTPKEVRDFCRESDDYFFVHLWNNI
jgi:hypothetical protein